MPNSYVEYSYPNEGISYHFKVYTPSGGIDGYIDPDFLEVYVNNSKIGYKTATKTGDPYWILLPELQGSQTFVVYNLESFPAGTSVRMQRVTPNKLTTFKDNILEFFNTEVLNAEQLNLALKAMIHLVQEAKEQNALVTTGGQYLPKDSTGSPQFWTAQGLDIRNLPATPQTATSATPKAWVEATIAAAAGNPGGPTGGQVGTSGIADLAVTTPKIATEAVNSSRLADNAVTTQKIVDDAVTTAKIEDDAVTDDKIREVNAILFPNYNGVQGDKIALSSIPGNRIKTATSATDCIPIGANTRPVSGIGQVLQSSPTGSSFFSTSSYGRTLMNAADAAGLRTALDLGTLSALDSVSNANIATTAAISLSKLQSIPASTFIGNTGSQSAAPSTIAISSFTLNSWGQPTTAVNMGAQRCINAASPQDPQDLTTKGWVESQIATAQVNTATGDAVGDLVYPIGSTLAISIDAGGTTTIPLNQSVTVYYNTGTNVLRTTAATGFTQLTGTWRCRGSNIVQAPPSSSLNFAYVQTILVQRVA
jgi:hypothetical protein